MSSTMFTIEEIKAAMKKADKIMRPTVCILHPDVLENLKQQDPDIEMKYVFLPDDSVDKDKAYLMSRESFENMTDIQREFPWQQMEDV